jgi:hypothetical protein
MGNVLSDEKKLQVLALGRLGWPLRRIQQEKRPPRDVEPVSARGGDRDFHSGDP